MATIADYVTSEQAKQKFGVPLDENVCILAAGDLSDEQTQRILEDYKLDQIAERRFVSRDDAAKNLKIQMPADASIVMPQPTDEKIGEVLKRFAAIFKGNLDERQRAAIEYGRYMQSHRDIRIQLIEQPKEANPSKKSVFACMCGK